MNGWDLLNWGAWGLSALIAVVILIDFVKVEKSKITGRSERRGK